MVKREIFSVGHSNHTIDYFYELLESYQINCLVDVRSMPASKYSPQYNQNSLRDFLKSRGVLYMHFKDEFGARCEDEEFLDENGQVNFELFRKSFNFQQGIERVDMGLSRGYKIALMCSEGNPLECHRFSMVAVYLNEIGIEVKHIMKDRQLKSHQELEILLLKKYARKLPKPSLFKPSVNQELKLKEAYRLHNKEIGWKMKKLPK